MADPKVVPRPEVSGAKKGASRGSGEDPLAAGAARASGERAKRRRTPLLMDPSGDEMVPSPAPNAIDVFSATGAHRPRPVPKSGPSLTAKAAPTSGTKPPSERLRAKTAISSAA
ncbi:MAG: hypothetical protein IMZ75_12625, partial [Actinobacteria bacterium]|nr:hypothetical protein [Actinomycetota bacterium]